MSAITKMLAVTTVKCDAPDCKTVGRGPGKGVHARAGLSKQGWECNDKTRTDYCPAHVTKPTAS